MTRRKQGSGSPGVPRRAEAYLLPTLIDRLRDDAPYRQTEAPEEYAMTRAQIRDIIQRDLAYLLNAANLEDQIDRERYPLAAASTVNFGVPALAGAFMASREWAHIEAIVKQAIKDFEPRLIADSLSIVPLQDKAKLGRHAHLTFEIRGLIRMDPYPLEFLVQSTLDLETSRLHATSQRA
ncbi:type VI secretion system lysozyme-like protein [Caballeronia calidae]|uniref:Type VI secretion system lysozyme-like protein n=1 Tax=Caballeronia calidae TaxID=1777139 RepID=A0A158D2G8_9BURK|nr:type VI secretion system baseplate subunit TssE [Caballeronia calidae]SAK88426.1 type VI secretion system lysozyme-like protein [Caballeronia calidae]